MDREDIEKRIGHLREELEYHNYRYYVLDDPAVTDREYDDLMRELTRLETEHRNSRTPHHRRSGWGRDPSMPSPRSPHSIPC